MTSIIKQGIIGLTSLGLALSTVAGVGIAMEASGLSDMAPDSVRPKKEKLSTINLMSSRLVVTPSAVGDPPGVFDDIAEIQTGRDQKEVSIYAKFDANGSDINDMKSGKVSVGVIPALRFTKQVPDDAKRIVAENFAVINNDGEEVAGSWAWTTDKVMRFRPEKFWKGKTKYTVLPVISDLEIINGPKRVMRVITPEQGWSFKTVRSLVGYVNANTHRLNVYVDGKKKKSFGVSLGKPGWETRSGIKVLSGSKEASKVYTSDSLGLTNETYRLTAPWNIRLTPTGEFLHSAPWAYGRIGNANGSHGCTNLRTEDAKWLYDNTVPGDVFVYRNTSKKMEYTNGPGGLWNVPAKKWAAGAGKILNL